MTHRISKALRYYAFIFCFAYIAQGDEVALKEYCTAYSTNPNSETTIPLNPPSGPSSPYTQSECVRYYTVNLAGKRDSDKYLLFELTFEYLPTNKSLIPVLLAKNTTKPSMNEKGVVPDDNDIDENGYQNKKTYYNILIDDLQTLQTTDKIYFALYQYNNDTKYYKTETLRYTIRTTLSSDYICQRRCSGNKGLCRQDLKQCVCNRGWFDLDCSRGGSEIVFESSLSQQLASQVWQYYYIDSKDYGGNLKFSIQKGAGTVYLTFLFHDATDYMLPNFDIWDGRFLLTSDNNDQNLKLPESGFKTHLGGRLMIGAYNVENEPVNIGFSVGLFDKEESSRSAIMFVMIGIASGLVILWIIFSILKYRAYRHAALVRRQQQLILLRSRLSKEELEQFFPTKNFGDMKSSFPQSMCSICLDDFRPETSCRQLYCEHIYHGPCIQEWFANHPSCPFCKKDMTRAAIEEFFKNPNGSNTDSPPAARDEEAPPVNQNQSLEKDQLVTNGLSMVAKPGSMKEINIEPPSSKRGEHKLEGERAKALSTEQVIVQNSSSLKVIPVDVPEEVGDNKENVLGG